MASTTTILPPPPARNPGDALFLDFDGTLVELAARPDSVRVDAELGALLDRIADDHQGAVALVSGRSIAQLDAILGERGRVLTLAGSHGGERRAPGKGLEGEARPSSLDTVAAHFRERFGARADMIIEEKSLGVTLHYRLDPDMADAALTEARALADTHGLRLQHGKMMVELRTDGHDKGSAIRALSLLPPFAGRAPVFLGDDVTDEAGFAACAALGGHGILVGDRRATAARHHLSDVAAVRRWLAGARR